MRLLELADLVALDDLVARDDPVAPDDLVAAVFERCWDAPRPPDLSDLPADAADVREPPDLLLEAADLLREDADFLVALAPDAPDLLRDDLDFAAALPPPPDAPDLVCVDLSDGFPVDLPAVRDLLPAWAEPAPPEVREPADRPLVFRPRDAPADRELRCPALDDDGRVARAAVAGLRPTAARPVEGD